MKDLEIKLEKYRENISLREVTDAFKVYYETKDIKVRQNLIYRYMPIVKRQVLNFEVCESDKEDLEQTAYLTLIQCIEKFNPYGSLPFSHYLYNTINYINKKYNANEELKNLSLSDIDIYSNEDLESNIIDNITQNEILIKLNKVLEQYPNKEQLKLFKKYFGINCDTIRTFELVRNEGISKTYLCNINNRILLFLFLKLVNEYKYYPSDRILKFFDELGTYWSKKLSEKTKKNIYKKDLSKLEYLALYNDCNEIKDSHELVKIKK